MTKLVICDNDGTLVTDDRVFTERTRQAVEKLHKQGIMFGLASGRDVEQIRDYAHKFGLSFEFDIAIGMNGCQLWDNINQTEKDYYYLTKEQILQILDFLNEFPEMNIQVHQFGKVYFKKIDKYMQESVNRNRANFVVMGDDLEQIHDFKLFKIITRGDPEMIPAIQEKLKNHPIPGIKAFHTQAHVFEFSNENVGKGMALKQFCQDNNIDLKDVIAFGDTTNDNDMLECCYGVCMSNGTDDTKAVSKYVTEYSNNEDGVARYLEEHVLTGD